MNYFDIIILIPLLWGGYKGFKKGFIIEIASFIALALGVWGGIKFSSISAKYLSEAFEISEKIMPLISFAITFILIVIAVFMLAKMIQKIIKMVALGFINKAAGALFGMLKFGLIMSVIINFTNILNNQVSFIAPEMKSSSMLYEPIGKIAQIIVPGIKDISINSIVENALKEEAHKRIDEASLED